MNYFGECITSGKWDNAEKYLSAFTKMDDNSFSVKMFSEMQRRKYLDVEAVDRQKLPSESVGRAHFYNAFKVLVEKNPILQDKLKFPCLDKSRLLKLIKQIMDWWVPYRVNMMPHTKNDSISLKHIPTVPSFVINNSSQEGDFLPASSGDSSNYSSCFTDVHHSTESTSLADANSLVCKKPTDKSVIWKLQQINEPSECRTLMLPDNSLGERVVQLVYSSSVDFILALTQNARHKLWRLQRNKHSVLKENANMEPQLYQPSSGILMTNDIAGDPKDAAPCFALNSSYLFSASGGKISVFSLDTFETLATFANPIEFEKSPYSVWIHLRHWQHLQTHHPQLHILSSFPRICLLLALMTLQS